MQIFSFPYIERHKNNYDTEDVGRLVATKKQV